MANHYFIFVFVSLFLASFAEDDVKIDVVKEATSCERKAKNGDVITMHYSGKLTNGKEFDSSYSRKQPFNFKLGAGQVIPGWEKGVPGMCIGEQRKLTVPPALAYGDQGFGDIIPAKSTLVFDIELMDLKDDDGTGEAASFQGGEHEHEHPDSFEAIDTNGDKQITSEEMTNYIKKFNEEGTEEKFENIDTIVGEIFQEDDKNKDGVISYEEYQHFEEGAEGADDTAAPDDEEEEDEVPIDDLKDEL